MSLPKIPLAMETATVAGVTVTFHGLTVAQCKTLAELAETDPEATGPLSLSYAFDVDVAEAEAWIDSVTPAVAAEIATHVMRASGMTEETGARFPA